MYKSTKVLDPDGILHEVFFPSDFDDDDDLEEQDPAVTAAFNAIPEAALTILEEIFDSYTVDYYRVHPEEIKVYPRAKRADFISAIIDSGAYRLDDEDDNRYVIAYGIMREMGLEFD